MARSYGSILAPIRLTRACSRKTRSSDSNRQAASRVPRRRYSESRCLLGARRPARLSKGRDFLGEIPVAKLLSAAETNFLKAMSIGAAGGVL